MNTTSDPVRYAPESAQYTNPSDFASLLDKEFKPKTDEARDAVEAAVRTLAEQALVNAATMTDDAYSSIEAIIAEIDRKLSEQINLVLHKDDFQKVESAWRGMHHLVYNTETDEKLKIRFMDVSKDEVRRTLRRHKGIAWDQSPIFKRIYEEEYGQLGGEPYGCLVADYYFDHTPPDVELLGAIAKISAASHAPFIAGSAPSLLGMESWQELANPRDLAKITSNLEHAPWNSLRSTEDSRYVGLAMPRFLSRLPYGAKTNPVDEFDFEEETDGADHRNYVWSNAAYAMAVNINRSFKLYGWCTMIRGVESGGTVENLPCHTFPTDDGGFDMKCPTEIAISDRRELEITVTAEAGVNPDDKGRAAPILVRVYELKSEGVFESADYFSLSNNDKALIGSDLLVRDEFILRPGDVKTIRRKSHPDLAAIGVVAGYRDLAQADWRAIQKIDPAPEVAWYRSVIPANKVRLQIDLQAKGIQLTPLK